MNFKNLINENKIAIITYVVLISFFSLYFIGYDKLTGKFEILMFLLVLIIGIFSIFYYSKNKKKLHNVAFVIIILFGIVCVFLSPITDISDEAEHIARVEIVSQGQITTDYVQIPGTTEYGFKTIESINKLYEDTNINVFNSHVDDEKINYTTSYFHSVFAQNPFYAYLVAAIGMIIAKLFDLNAIWLLWLPRLANLLLYAIIIYVAIKKAPVFKIPLLIVSILPIAIYQGASTSADCVFNAFAILAIAYFFVLYKSNSIKWKDLGIFYLSIVLAGLIKAPYLALSLLIFLIPAVNFKDKKQNILSKLAILGLLLIGISWSSYSTNQITNSWRATYFIANHVDPQEQMNFLLSNPSFDISYFFMTLAEIPNMAFKLFYFSSGNGIYNSLLLASLYSIFFILFTLFYPLKEELSKINRLKTVIIGIIIYVSIFLVQYLTWIPVRSNNVGLGVFGRYFIPLLIFLPLIFNLNLNKKIDKDQLLLIVVTIAISFIAGMIMLTVGFKY